MKYRTLGKTGLKISEISLGTWQVGGKWGTEFDNDNAERIINSAIDKGVNFIDTADVYGNGLSEAAVGRVVRSRSEKVYVASKCGRQITPHRNEGYKPEVLTTYVEDTLRRTGLETLDLIQLHCPPTDVYYRPEIFETFDQLKKSGKIQHFGVSVEKVEEGIKAMEYDNVATIQLIFNIFRQRPKEKIFPQAKEKNVGIIVRVPLASGLLSGKYSKDTVFNKDDHRNFNREGQVFDKGETFAGVDYEQGLKAVRELEGLFPDSVNLAQIALQWILRFEEVSCVIPGASRPEQVESNISAFDAPHLTAEQMEEIEKIYNQYIKPQVHQRW